MIFDRVLYDLTGQTFGRLTVIAFDEAASLHSRASRWFCLCSCGNFTGAKNGPSMRCSQTRSCGCLRSEAQKKWRQERRMQKAA